MTMPREALTTRVTPAVKAALEELAKADGRTLSQYIERVLLIHLSDKGNALRSSRPERRQAGRKASPD
jgi:predicted transcriptional regulator